MDSIDVLLAAMSDRSITPRVAGRLKDGVRFTLHMDGTPVTGYVTLTALRIGGYHNPTAAELAPLTLTRFRLL